MTSTLLVPSFTEAAARSLVESCGAVYGSDGYGPAAHFAALAPASEADFARGVIAPLPDLGLLSASGADANAFLHSQLTNDIEHLRPDVVQLNGYCSPKGRLLATALNWRDEDAVYLLVARALAAGLRKRLSMFVLRAKVLVTDVSDTTSCFGLAGADAEAALSRWNAAWPAPGSVVVCGSARVLGLPAVQIADRPIPRALLIAPLDQAAEFWQGLAPRLRPIDTAQWRWTDIRAAVPRIVPASVERFVPQMVNFDLVGGVSFKKGCYPGQEIVARSHFLGKLKRRMFAARVSGDEPAPGSDVYDIETGEPCGEVVLAAPTPDGSIELLFECQIAAAGQARLDAGRPLEPIALPYELPTA